MPIKNKMTSGQKVAFSFLFSLFLFAFAAVLLHTRFFSEIEADFYSQSKIQEKTEQLDEISVSIENYIQNVLDIIARGESPYIKKSAVRSYYVQNPSESDVVERRRLAEELFSKIPELKGLRIVDRNARILHFSTFDDSDILSQNGISKTYKNYPDIQKDSNILPFELISENSFEDKSKVLFDSERNEILISVPFYWIEGIYSGAAIFYIDLAKLKNHLEAENVIAPSQGFAMISDEKSLSGGFVVNFPSGFFKEIKEKIFEQWKTSAQKSLTKSDDSDFGRKSLIRSKTEMLFDAPEKIAKIDDRYYLVVINSSVNNSFYLSGVYSSELFELSSELKFLIYVSTFITIFLIIFLLFSFRNNPEVLLQKRLKKLQLEIIEEYLEKYGKVSFYDFVKKLKSRKKDLSEDIIKSLNLHSKKQKLRLSEFLEKNWDEIFNALGVMEEPSFENSLDSEKKELLFEIRKMCAEVLAEVSNANKAEPLSSSKATSEKKPREIVQDTGVESPQKIEDAELVEELEDAEPIEDVEPVEELDDVEEIEDAEPVEELDDVEEIEDAESIEDVEPIEEIEDAEPVEEIEDAEPVEEIEDAEPVEELEVLEELEEIRSDSTVFDDDKFKAQIMALGNNFRYEYRADNESYFPSEDFATVENLFAEPLGVGSGFVFKSKGESIDFTIYIPSFLKKKNEDDCLLEYLEEDLEVLSEASDFNLEKKTSYYSLTNFAASKGV